MIWESKYWKDDLIRRARELNTRRSQRRWLESSFARVEQSIMIGFYTIRKLIEANKLSDSVKAQNVTLTSYPRKSKNITRLNWDKIEELYELNDASTSDIALLNLCHEFVHSYVFVPELGEQGGLAGVYFASDRSKERRLLFITTDQIVTVFTQVGSDYPSENHWIFKPAKGDYDISNC